jgi:DNA (cytosine-5)-methyltransferase 1
MCESDEWRRGVLRARFPGVPVYDDVRAVYVESAARSSSDGSSAEPDGAGGLHAGTVPRIDLLAGGVPCQDWSVAGKRAGISGERSGLFFEFARLADALRPAWLVFENVPGLLSSCACLRCQDGGGVLPEHRGADFAVVLSTLANVGYGLAWRVFDSRFFGVPQRRRRVFIVGALAGGDPRAAAECAGEILAVGARCGWHPATRGEKGTDVAPTLGASVGGGRGWDANPDRTALIAFTLKSQRGKDGGGIGPEETLVAAPLEASDGHHGYSSPRGDGADNLVVAAPLSHGSNPNSNMAGRRREDDYNLVAYSLRSNERNTSQGNANYISGPASVRRLTPRECERLQALPDDWTNPDGDAPDSRRYAALGDAVTASVAEWIGQRIIDHERPRNAA